MYKVKLPAPPGWLKGVLSLHVCPHKRPECRQPLIHAVCDLWSPGGQEFIIPQIIITALFSL